MNVFSDILTRFQIMVIVVIIISGCTETGARRKMEGFKVEQINDALLNEMVKENIFGPHSPVPAERLRLVNIRHYDFQDSVHEGQLVVMDAVSEHVMKLFQDLFARKFAIDKVNVITVYNGSDSLSMADNNTSAHNLRPLTEGEELSLHAYGTAVDINPVQNPYVDIPCESDSSFGVISYQPAEGLRYANRMENRLGKKNRRGMAERVVDVFARHGFYWWGGYWDCPIDYQHFQVSRAVTEILTAMSADEAIKFFDAVVKYYNENKLPMEDALSSRVGKPSLVQYYVENPQRFWEIVDELGEGI